MPEEGQPDDKQLQDQIADAASVNELLRQGRAVKEKSEWELSGIISKQEDEYYSSPPKWRWFWKTPVYTFGCGIPAIVGILGQFALPWLDHACGQPLGENVDAVRTVMLFGGFLLLMLASPVYRSNDWKPADDVQSLSAREDFRRKFRR